MALSREAKWATCEGSLQRSVKFKPQMPAEEAEIESHPLLLRPSPASAPQGISRSPNVRREGEMPELPTFSSQPLICTTLSMEDTGGCLSSGTVPRDLLPDGKNYPDSVSTLHEVAAENVELGENNLKDAVGRAQTPEYTCERKDRRVEIEGGPPASGGFTSANKQLPDRLSEPEIMDCFTQCCTEELKSNGVDKGIGQRTGGEITLGHLLKRMDRLGALCMRIEDHVHQALNNMERRLQLVESRHMPPNPSVPTETEGVTLHSGLSSLPNLCSNSLASCPGILGVNNCKHMPDEPCTESYSLDSMSNAFVGSSADCSSASAASSSSVILPSHGSHPVNSTLFDSIMDKSMFGSLDQQVMSKAEKFLGNSQGSAACAKEEISAGSLISGNFICEHPTPAKSPALAIDEALALALSAFSASVGCPRIEARDTSTEAPCCSSGLENSNVDVRYSGAIGFDDTEGLRSPHQAATTAVYTAGLCGSSEVDITDDNEIYYDDDDDTVFSAVEGVRYISQEGMGSVPYGSSQGSQDARHVLYRRGKVRDFQDGIAVAIKQTCKLGAEIMINQRREIMLPEVKIEGRLCNGEIALAGKDPDSVYVIQDTSICRQESSMVHAGQEQLPPLERPEELERSKQRSKHTHLISKEGHDQVVDKSSAFIPVTGLCGGDILSIEGICSNWNNEASKAETSIESSDSKQSRDKPIKSKLHSDLLSLLDVSFTVSNTCEMRMPLEALLYNSTPEQHRETVCLQESTELGPLMNFSEPRHPHGLFFVEDEDLRDFIVPSFSTLITPLYTGNRADRGMVAEASPNFESLL